MLCDAIAILQCYCPKGHFGVTGGLTNSNMTFLRHIAVKITQGTLSIRTKTGPFQVCPDSLQGSLYTCSTAPHVKNSSLVIFLAFESTSHWTLTKSQVLSSPFDSAILEPDFNLCFIEAQVSREIEPLCANNVLLTVKLFFQSFELICREDCTLPFRPGTYFHLPVSLVGLQETF